MTQKLLGFLGENQSVNGSWVDKWHVSPYYSTGHALIALQGIDENMSSLAIEFLIKSQRHDGGWGFHRSTAEETFYVLQALLGVSGQDYSDVIRKAERYLRDQGNNFEALWVDKGLYCPINVTKSNSVIYEW